MSLRAFRLLGVAAEAEGLRWKRNAQSTVRSAVLSAVAGLFGLAALAFFHMAGWIALRDAYGSIYASGGVAVVDLVLMGIVLFLARSKPDPVAEAALNVRKTSLAEAARVPLLGDVLGLVGMRSPASIAGGLVAERIVRALQRR